MGPRFDDPQYFQPDGSLEACGPSGVSTDQTMTVLHVTITDKDRNKITYDQPTQMPKGAPMWEILIPGARATLVPGKPANGAATATITNADGTVTRKNWVGTFELVDLVQFATDAGMDPAVAFQSEVNPAGRDGHA